MEFRHALIATFAAALLSACGDAPDANDIEQLPAAPTPPKAPNIVLISAESYGPEWPFSMEEMHLICLRRNAVVVADVVTGDTYPLNGPARTQSDMDTLDDIWLENPELPGTRYSVGPLIHQGLELCQ